MADGLHPNVVWQGVRPELVCHGPDEVVAAYVTGYEATHEIDSLELLGSDTHVVLGARAPDLSVGDVETGGEIYNVFAIEGGRITRIEDYLERGAALAAGRI
jgi:hypothetical protein